MTARRARDAGVAQVLPRRGKTAERLGALLREVLSSERMRRAAAEVGERIRARRTLERAVEWVAKN